MTFDEWWKVMKPAECDELKEYFIEAYQLGFSNGCARLRNAEILLHILAGSDGNEVDLLCLREETRNYFRRHK
jgi:hypothetical protein